MLSRHAFLRGAYVVIAVAIVTFILVPASWPAPAPSSSAGVSPTPPPPCLLAPGRGEIVDPFRAPMCPWCPGNRGLEYATAPGGAVVAGGDGVVTFAGSVAGVRYVVVEHPWGLRTTYGRVAVISTASGRAVSAGTPIAVAADRTFFGLRNGDRYLDPAPYLATTRRRPRLVPTDGRHRRPDRSAITTCPARSGRSPPDPEARVGISRVASLASLDGLAIRGPTIRRTSAICGHRSPTRVGAGDGPGTAEQGE
jgi:hypothetical protein